MSDFRISAAVAGGGDLPRSTSLVGALIHLADDIAERFDYVASNLPYSAYGDQLLRDGVAGLVKEIGAATWKRIGREVPSYAFAEALGKGYAESGASMAILMLHWQILRRATHLVLADQRIRTGHGDEDLLRQTTLMNYIIDWSIEASLVGYVLAQGVGLDLSRVWD